LKAAASGEALFGHVPAEALGRCQQAFLMRSCMHACAHASAMSIYLGVEYWWIPLIDSPAAFGKTSPIRRKSQ
jgi:hypothetical protein